MSTQARSTDPQTSHDAAEKVKHRSKVQSVIYNILWTGGAMTDPQIAEHYYGRVADGSAPNHSESGLRTRRKELVDAGVIKATGEKDKLDTGRYANLWALENSGANLASMEQRYAEELKALQLSIDNFGNVTGNNS